ncbi:hypothetical protein HZF02_25215 [Pseudomonas yamanorum]|nr:hypothetical protein HZF02_25215 [Pseudomonas yamanorum]
MSHDLSCTAIAGGKPRQASTLAADQALMNALSNHLRADNSQPFTSSISGSTLDHWLQVYCKASNRPCFLAWTRQQKLPLNKTTVRLGRLEASDSKDKSPTHTDLSGWRRLALPILNIAELLDPNACGLPYLDVGNGQFTVKLTFEQIIRFYGFPIPQSPSQRRAVCEALESMTPFDTQGLADALQALDQDLRQLANTLESMVSTHADDEQGFHLTSPYSTRFRLHSHSILSRDMRAGADLLDQITRSAEFLALDQAHDLDPGQYRFVSPDGPLIGSKYSLIEVPIDLEQLLPLADTLLALRTVAKRLNCTVHQHGQFSVAELCHGLGLVTPQTAEQALELATQLRKAQPLSIPLLDDRVASPVAIAQQRRQIAIENERYTLLETLDGLIAGKTELTVIDSQAIKVEADPDRCHEATTMSLEALLKIHDLPVPRTLDQARLTLRTLEMRPPIAPSLGNYWEALDQPPPTALTLSKAQQTTVLNTVSALLPRPVIGLFDLLVEGLLTGYSKDEVRDQADTILKQMINHQTAQTLAKRLITALGWYGKAPGEKASHKSHTTLILSALILSLDSQAGQRRYVVAGLDLNHCDHWASTYPDLRNTLELHLVSTGKVSAEAAPVAAHLLLAGVAPEFLVQGIPDALRFMTAHAWMLFKQGVMQAEAIASGSSRQMSFNDITTLASQIPRSAEERQWIEHYGLGTLIDWSVAQGDLAPAVEGTTLSIEVINGLKARLKTRMTRLNAATRQLQSQPPSRREMALQDLQRVFPDNRLLEKECLRWKSWHYTDSHTHLPPLPYRTATGSLHSAVDLHMNGMLATLADVLESTDENFDLIGLQGSVNRLHGIEIQFNKRFATYISRTKAAYDVYIRYLLCQLPLADRCNLQQGELQWLVLSSEPKKMLEQESAEEKQARTGRYGAILRCQCENTVHYYEIFALLNRLQKNTTLPKHIPIGGRPLTIATGSAQSAHPATTLFLGHKLEIDWQAYASGKPPRTGQHSKVIVEKLLTLDAPPPSETSTRALALDSSRAHTLAETLVHKHFFLEVDQLFKQAKGSTTLEKRQAHNTLALNMLKRLVPFWSCREELASGDLRQIIAGGYGCFLDILGVFVPTNTLVSSVAKSLRSTSSIPLKLLQMSRLSALFLTQMLNPLDGIVSLLRITLHGLVRLGQIGRHTLQVAIGQARQALNHIGALDYIKLLGRGDIATGALIYTDDVAYLMAIMRKKTGMPSTPSAAGLMDRH